jgi:small subunit ribosomal protein S1
MKYSLKENEFLKPLKAGEIVEGKIIGRGKSSIFLDLANKGTGIIYGKEFFEAKDILKELKIGQNIFAKVIDPDNEEGYVELSISRASEELALEVLKQKKEREETIKVKILGANKGGLLAEISGMPAFLPVSQLSSENYPRVEDGESTKILRELQKFIGKELEVKIFNLNQRSGEIILSEKIREAEKIKESLKNYKVGDAVEGEITGLTDFGAFLRFDKNLEGLIHISELDWKLIKDPSEVVKIGEKVKAEIIDISNDRVSLSLKALKRDPWLDFAKSYKKRGMVKGEVTKFTPFGAFVQIHSQIQGLCHVSEFGSVSKMKERLKIGQEYDFKIVEIQPKEHKLTLKLAA